MTVTVFVVWIAVTSVISLITTAYDKWASRYAKRNRVPEKVLFLLSLVGGSAAMYLTMLTIRHKTKHKRFMIGIPLIMLMQYGVIFYFFRLR